MKVLIIGENWYTRKLEDKITASDIVSLGTITEKQLSDDGVGVDVDKVHVCFPYHGYFLDNMKLVADMVADGAIFLVHSSTLPIGTTEKLAAMFADTHPNSYFLHCPIFEGKDFIPVGGIATTHYTFDVKHYLKKLGYTSEFWLGYEVTEAASLLASYYDAVNYMFAVDAKKFCDKNDIDFGDGTIARCCQQISIGSDIGNIFSKRAFQISKTVFMFKNRFGIRGKLSTKMQKMFLEGIFEEFDKALEDASDNGTALVEKLIRTTGE